MKQIVLVLFMAFFAVSLSGCGYNSMQANEEVVVAAWGDVEAAYQRRADLVPNLVEVTREYAAHEKKTLIAVTEARARVQGFVKGKAINDPQAFDDFMSAQGELGSAISRLMVVMENYPALRADESFLTLQSQIEGTENRINVARVRYNDAVSVFNTSIRKFPNMLTNRLLLKLKRREPFKAEPGVDKAPAVMRK